MKKFMLFILFGQLAAGADDTACQNLLQADSKTKISGRMLASDMDEDDDHTKNSHTMKAGNLQTTINKTPCVGFKIFLRQKFLKDITCVTTKQFEEAAKRASQGQGVIDFLKGQIQTIAEQQGKTVCATNLDDPDCCADMTAVDGMAVAEHAFSTDWVDPKPRKGWFDETIGSFAVTGEVGKKADGKANRQSTNPAYAVGMSTLLNTDLRLAIEDSSKQRIANGKDVQGLNPLTAAWWMPYALLFDAYGDYQQKMLLKDFFDMVFKGKVPIPARSDVVFGNPPFHSNGAPNVAQSSPAIAVALSTPPTQP